MRNVVAAERMVPAPREAIFDSLADLENHWRLTDSFEVVDLEGPPGSRRGGLVRMRGPLGIHRTARTRVVAADPPAGIEGSAELGNGTHARVSWELRDAGAGATHVRLEATIEEAGLLDRVLLAAGGRAWMRRRFAVALESLASRFA